MKNKLGMKRYVLLSVIILILAFSQSIFSNSYFVLLFSLSFFIVGNDETAVKTAFIGGVMLDLLGTASFGQFALSATSVMVFLMLFKSLLGKTLLFQFIFAILAIMLFNFMIHLPNLLEIKTLAKSAPANLVFLVLMLPLVSWINELFKKNTIRRN